MSAFDQQLEEQRADLLRYARYLVLGNAISPDDLVQETFLLALRLKDSFRRGTNLRAWLFAIMRNEYRNELRKARRRKAVFLTGIDIDIDGLVDSAEFPVQQDSQAALNDTLAAIRTLPAQYREVLVLVAIKGLSYAETAALLDTPIGTVRSRLSRARAKLVVELEKK